LEILSYRPGDNRFDAVSVELGQLSPVSWYLSLFWLFSNFRNHLGVEDGFHGGEWEGMSLLSKVDSCQEEECKYLLNCSFWYSCGEGSVYYISVSLLF
jgi:hypothetical protein